MLAQSQNAETSAILVEFRPQACRNGDLGPFPFGGGGRSAIQRYARLFEMAAFGQQACQRYSGSQMIDRRGLCLGDTLCGFEKLLGLRRIARRLPQHEFAAQAP